MEGKQRPNFKDCDFEYDDDDPEGYRAGMFRPGPQLGAEETGMSVYDLPPGQAICPYHYEYAEEEWVVVVSGRPTLRTPAGEEELKPGDVAFFERGSEGVCVLGLAVMDSVRAEAQGGDFPAGRSRPARGLRY